MDRGERFSFEVRAVLVTWRGVMHQIRAGLIPESRASAERVTALSLDLLAFIGARYPDKDAHASSLLREAREEIRAAAFHDLADGGQLNA